MNINNYNEVTNGKETYKTIATELENDKSVGIGWTDEDCTHLDIIFTLGFKKYCPFQRGIKGDYLIVSIIDYTSYAFKPDSIKKGDYIQEKLRIHNELGDKLAELINGIIFELQESKCIK